MLTATDLSIITQQLASNAGRVVKVTLANETVIIKRQESRQRPFGYSALNFLAKIFQQPILCAVPAPGGATGQAIEVARLRELRAAGVNVPEVRHVGDGWIALSDAGVTSIDHLIDKSPQPQLPVWEAGLAAILDTHQKNQTLSQAFARNIIFDHDQVTFIDFEDDPVQVLSLAQAQTRDWLLYLHSTAHMLRDDRTTLAKTLQSYIALDRKEVQKLIANSADGLSWLRHLPSQRKPWGRDVVSLQAAAAVLYAMRRLQS